MTFLRAIAILLVPAALLGGHARALTPVEAARIDAQPPIGVALPATLRLRDESGRGVTLGTYWVARPAVLVLGYYGCSNLCSVVLHGLASSLQQAGLRAGRDADVVAVSIDPQETPALAATRKETVLADSGATADARGWHFLTGDAAAIEALTRAVGYAYDYDTASGTFAHPAGILVIAPGGTVRAQLGGVAFDAGLLRQSIVGAAPSTPWTRWLLCFHDDPLTGRHTPAAITATRLAGAGALVLLLAVVARASVRARRTRSADPS